MLTKREKDVLAAVAGTCGIWLLVAVIVTAYAFANERDERAEHEAHAAAMAAKWAKLEAQGCRMVACERIGK
jgi:hypothetical protein